MNNPSSTMEKVPGCSEFGLAYSTRKFGYEKVVARHIQILTAKEAIKII